jgi:Flp pilus assembly protein TadD
MALLRLAEYDLLHGRADLARPRLELATAKHPSSGEAWTLLGHVALELHDPERATLAYRQAAALDPNNLVARLGVGWARLGANDLAGAGEAWRPLVLAARDPATLQQMVLVFHALGDTPAEREAQAAIERTAAKP